MIMTTFGLSAHATGGEQTEFKRIPTQFIAVLGDPGATSGSDAQSWGLWRVDPGPRGVWLDSYEQLKAADGIAPAQWKFDSTDWWLEEHGLIMEKPDFPIAPGKYMVTGDREVMTVLTVYAMDEDGAQRWELDNGANLYDVTHLRCRSARYTPSTSDNSCSPAKAQRASFPVSPGGPDAPSRGLQQARLLGSLRSWCGGGKLIAGDTGKSRKNNCSRQLALNRRSPFPTAGRTNSFIASGSTRAGD